MAQAAFVEGQEGDDDEDEVVPVLTGALVGGAQAVWTVMNEALMSVSLLIVTSSIPVSITLTKTSVSQASSTHHHLTLSLLPPPLSLSPPHPFLSLSSSLSSVTLPGSETFPCIRCVHADSK